MNGSRVLECDMSRDKGERSTLGQKGHVELKQTASDGHQLLHPSEPLASSFDYQPTLFPVRSTSHRVKKTTPPPNRFRSYWVSSLLYGIGGLLRSIISSASRISVNARDVVHVHSIREPRQRARKAKHRVDEKAVVTSSRGDLLFDCVGLKKKTQLHKDHMASATKGLRASKEKRKGKLSTRAG